MAASRVVIIGAGPAGVRAAETLVNAGLRPVLIDEAARDGGQIYRRQPAGFKRPASALYGSEADRADNLHQSFERLRDQIDYRPRCLAWNISERVVHGSHDGRSEAFPFDALIIASGATDRLMPVKGWDLAGVYSLGAAQIALKSQAAAIGHHVVLMGTGPLLQLLATQYIKTSVKIAALLDTTPFISPMRALPKLLARPDVMIKGINLVTTLAFSGIPIFRGITPIEITGDAEMGVDGVIVRLASGEIRHFECDAVAMGYHLRPETQLADLARCAFEFDEETRQYWPKIDEDGRSSVSGVYLAGDGVRTQGADGAEISGQLAAHAVLADWGHTVPASRIAKLRTERMRMERFRRAIAAAYPWPHKLAATLPDETIVCRCEGITAGTLRATVVEKGGVEMNRAKALSRVGMGRCQGRYCGHAAAEIIAAQAGCALANVGRIRGQAPVKPLSIATARQDS